MISQAKSDEIVCIGTASGVEVNAYYSGTNWNVPVVEVLCHGRVAMTLAQTEGAIDLLQEALAHWQEEGKHIHPNVPTNVVASVSVSGSPFQ